MAKKVSAAGRSRSAARSPQPAERRSIRRAKPRIDNGPEPTATRLESAAREQARGMSRDASEVIDDLIHRRNRDLIVGVVGETYADELRGLASRAQATEPGDEAKRVLIIPGVTGSTLAVRKRTVWFDPHQIAGGKLKDLAIKPNDSVRAAGIFWPTYLELKLRLKIAGYQPEFFPFDWRKSVIESARSLVQTIKRFAASGQPVALVAHGMGGLVGRAALRMLGNRADKLVSETILLGTPNSGCFAPAMLLTNQYPMVRWIERLDEVSEKGELVRDVFSTFVGLAEMLPDPEHANGVDLLNVATYPAAGRAVRGPVLKQAKGLQAKLAAGSKRIWMIVGTGHETVVGIKPPERVGRRGSAASKGSGGASDAARFEFELSHQGDGTVPLKLAELPGANHRYCTIQHGKLPSDDEVIRAVVELLKGGKTSKLHANADEAMAAALRRSQGGLSEGELFQRINAEGRSGLGLTDRELLAALDPLVGIPMRGDIGRVEPNESTALLTSSQPIVIGRKHQTRLDVRLTFGNVTEARGTALMLGIFKDVRPGGAAGAVDEKLGGVLAEIVDRRMFSANVGELFVLPTPRHGLNVEMVVLVGLGNFALFNPKSLRTSVENAARTLLRCQVDDLVTVPLGGGSGLKMEELALAIIEGLQAGLKDARGRQSLRGLGIITHNEADFRNLNEGILRLASAPNFDDMEFTLEREVLPSAPRGDAAKGAGLTADNSSTYLLVKETRDPSKRHTENHHHIEVGLLGRAGKATVITDEIKVATSDLAKLLDKIDAARQGEKLLLRARELGVELANLLLPKLIREAIESTTPETLTLINDFWGSKLPWELLTVGEWNAGLDGNLSRKYLTANISVAKWLHQRRVAKELDMLLVVNPTGDLPGAEREGKRLVEMAQKFPEIRVTEVKGIGATKGRLSEEFASGKYDLVHYAGHAYFNEQNRSESGILCAKDEVLSGRDLANLNSLPSLVVFNACESARVRSGELPTRSPKSKTAGGKAAPIAALVDRNVSLAEAFLRCGVGAFVGTYWQVGDNAAGAFAEHFYRDLLESKTVGEALRSARKGLYKTNEADWVNYIHYGDSEFKVKSN